ncbi:antitoxin Xre/MbcA/ParS toxin-binding domain-containing protein [Pseudomonas sp. 9AZ]|uniref:antitoxin Xre/MbcA/ParS toxin-binding domain-containing protein n=1 Tax=Pseudomonas sp. 9AZ TaxID=2653168 RepID=UPI003556C1AE
METRASRPTPGPTGRDNCSGLLMQKLYDRLGLPKTHYRMHQAVLAGLPVTLVADLAHELGLRRTQVARWVGTSFRHSVMSVRTGEVFCRLVETLDALLELHEGDLDGALRWLTSPVLTLVSERPIDLLVTEPGRRAVLQVIHAIEHGLPA